MSPDITLEERDSLFLEKGDTRGPGPGSPFTPRAGKKTGNRGVRQSIHSDCCGRDLSKQINMSIIGV